MDLSEKEDVYLIFINTGNLICYKSDTIGNGLKTGQRLWVINLVIPDDS